MKYEPSAAVIRTTLAWRRTALALAVLATLSIKLTLVNHQVIGMIASTVALLGSGLLYIAQFKSNKKMTPLVLLFVCSAIIAMLGIATIVQVV